MRTRALPAALLAIAWRLARCNPLVTRRVHDPVRRTSRLRPRGNAVATSCAALAVGGLGFIVMTEVVHAQSIDGGCEATINGVAPEDMPEDDPLLVHEGESVEIRGTVPDQVADLPDDQINSQTNIKVLFIEGLAEPKYEQRPGTGPEWGGSVDVDSYLDVAVGLYKVEGTASGTPGWSCTGSGYIELDGNPLEKPMGQGAAAVTVAGGLGTVFASRRKPPVTAMAAKMVDADMGGAPAPSASPTADSVGADFGRDVDAMTGYQSDAAREAAWTVGCAVLVLIIILSGLLTLGALAAVPAPAARGRTVWVKGHVVLGVISGWFLGLGLAVLIQQYAYWTLSIQTVIVFPILIAVLCGLRAFRGRPFTAPT